MPPSAKSTSDRIIEYGVNFKTNMALLLEQLSNIARSADSNAVKMEKSFTAVNKVIKETGGNMGLLVPALEKAQMEAAKYGTTFQGLDKKGNLGIEKQAMNQDFYKKIQPELAVRSRAAQELMDREFILGIRKQEEEVAASTARVIEKGMSNQERQAQKLAAKAERDALAAEKRQARAIARADKIDKQEKLRTIQQPIMIEVDEAKQALKVEQSRAKAKADYNKWAEKYRTGQKGELDIEKKQTAEAKKQTAETTNQANIIKMTIAQKRQLALIQYTPTGQGIANMGEGQWMKQVNATKVLIKQLSAEFKVSTGVAAKWAADLDIDGEIVRQALKEVRQEAKGLAGTLRQTFGNVQNYISTAFGVSLAMILFKAQMAVSQFFAEALQKARDLRDNMRELQFSEGVLSKNGVEITIQGLKDIAKEIERLNLGLSKTESIDLMGKVAQSAKSIVGMTEEGLRKIALTVAYIQALNPAIEAGTVVNAILDRKDTQINQFVQFNDDTIRAKAVELKLIKDINSELSDQAAQLAIIEIIYDGAGQYADDYAESIKGTSKGIELAALQASNSLKENVGGALLAVTTQFQVLFLTIAPGLQWFLDTLTVGVITAMAYFNQLAEAISKTIDAAKSGNWNFTVEFDKERFQKDVANGINTAFKDSDSETAKAWMKRLEGYQDLLDPENLGVETGTPTNAGGTGVLTDEQVSKIKEGADDILEDMNDMYDDLSKMEDEYLKDSARAWEDYQQDLKRLKEDYEHDLLMASKDSNDDIAQENADFANEELEAALKFQEEMRQLRERFLFDLEDALAARDARQVIRLQKQYAMDVTNKTNEFDLERQERLRAHELELNDIRNQTNNKLAELKYEYDLRVQRMEEDNNLEKQRRDQDHIDDMKRREQEMTDKITQWGLELETEYGIKTEGVQKLYDELGKFYGTDGKFNVMYRGSFQDILNMAGQFNTLLDQQILMAAAKAAQVGSFAGTVSGAANRFTGGLSNFTPFVSPQPRPPGGGGGGQGNLQIDLNLSPDLEVRVVNNAMNGVAEVITNASRNYR